MHPNTIKQACQQLHAGFKSAVKELVGKLWSRARQNGKRLGRLGLHIDFDIDQVYFDAKHGRSTFETGHEEIVGSIRS